MPRQRPPAVTTLERDKCRLNLAWKKYGFEFFYSRQPESEWQEGQKQPKEHIVAVHNKLGVICEVLRWEKWRPCYPLAPPVLTESPLDGDYESLDVGIGAPGDWRNAALASLEPERLPKPLLFSRRQIVQKAAWRDPFIVSVVVNLLLGSLKSTHHAYSPAGPIPAP